MENEIKEETFTEELYYVLFMEGIDCVYFVKDNLSNMIKIGYTNGLKNRMNNVLRGPDVCSNRKLLRVIHGTYKTESALHKKFEDIRWINENNKKREWFHINDELVDFVNSLKTSFLEPQVEYLKAETKEKVEENWDSLDVFLDSYSPQIIEHLDEIRYLVKPFHEAYQEWCCEVALRDSPNKTAIRQQMINKGFNAKSSNGQYFYYRKN